MYKNGKTKYTYDFKTCEYVTETDGKIHRFNDIDLLQADRIICKYFKRLKPHTIEKISIDERTRKLEIETDGICIAVTVNENELEPLMHVFN